MIDTIKITLHDGMFIITDKSKFKPSAEVVLRSYLNKVELIRAIQNPTKEDTQNKIYKPRLTLQKRFVEITLTIEFSIPKLMFGNNFEEVNGLDFPLVLTKLQSILKEMGVEVEEVYLRDARVNIVHFGKNFILTDVIRSITMINLIAKADTTFRTDISTKLYKNGGQLVSFYTKVQEIVFYDKMKDLQRSLNISKARSEEVDAELQRQFLAEYGRHEVLRMEVRLSKPDKIKRVIKKEYGKEIESVRFCHVFDEELSKKIVTNYLNQLKTMLHTVIASHKDGLLQFFIYEGVKPQKAFVLTKAMELIKEYGERHFRTMFPTVHKQVGKIMESTVGTVLNMENHNSQFLTNAFNRLEDVLYNFKPIRLENGKDIYGNMEITNSNTKDDINNNDYEYLPTKADLKYKNMKITIKKKDIEIAKQEKEEEELEAIFEDDDEVTKI